MRWTAVGWAFAACVVSACSGSRTEAPTEEAKPAVAEAPAEAAKPATIEARPAAVEATPEPAAEVKPASAEPTAPLALEPARDKALMALAPEDYAMRQATLGQIERCTEPGNRPTADEPGPCAGYLTPGVVGVKDGLVALLSAKEVGSCGEWGPKLTATISTLPDMTATSATPLPDPEETPEAAHDAGWAWLGGLKKTGFDPVRDLITATVEQPSGIRSHTPLVHLGPPLAGWLVDATAGEKAATFRLIGPDRRTVHPLGTIDNIVAECEAEDRANGACADAAAPTVMQVVLSADQTRLIVTAAMGDGTHCGSDAVRFMAWPVPAGIVK